MSTHGGSQTDIDDLHSRIALFLDLDGTLIDLAPTPDAVEPPSGLSSLIAKLTRSLDGAVAILSGRTIAGIDRLLYPLQPPAAGVHGAEFRARAGGEARMAAPLLAESFIREVARLAAFEPGVLIEAKGAAVAVHFRQAEHGASEILRRLRILVGSMPARFDIRPGKMVFEIIPANVSKSRALAEFMRMPPFHGREPIMIGDDAADLDAFSAAEGFGGRGLRVAGEFFSPDVADFSGTAAVHRWLEKLLDRIAAERSRGDGPCD